jgi:NAD(P)-dependent dehydrogenase (short-subunit alcohol dehydrogenase family)
LVYHRCIKGFRQAVDDAALKRGDKVAATARDIGTLDDLQDEFDDLLFRTRLDVTDRSGAFSAVRTAHEHFGQLDVVVNNAGYGQFGFVEELTESEARSQLETNFFGALWVTQAALPIMRAQQSGHIVHVSSLAGVAAFPNLDIYHASKWALEGLSEALAHEVASHGIHVTLVEPAWFKTDWLARRRNTLG